MAHSLIWFVVIGYAYVPGGKLFRMFVKWYQFRSEVSIFVWGVGGMGPSASGTSGGKEERVGQDLEQARSG